MQKPDTKGIAILLIAAGSSSRLGQPKQLLPYRGSFLLNYILNECIESKTGKVHIVLGAHREKIRPKLEGLNCEIIENENWPKGMGNSIACGMAKISPKKYQGVIIVLGDQPFFTRKLLVEIIAEREQSKAPIVLSKYKKGMGPPTFFSKDLFRELLELEGDIGAKPIIQKYFDNLALVPFEKGHLDVDTESDLELLN